MPVRSHQPRTQNAEQPMNALSRLVLLPAVVLLAAAPAHRAAAQFATSLVIDRTTFLVQEPIEASVTIMNRSGSDVVMSGRTQRGSWLAFDITDPAGRPLSPVMAGPEAPFVFKAGDTIARKIFITDTFALSEPGNYGIKATVFHPPSGQYYSSNGERIVVLEQKPFKTFPFGVPEGFRDAGRTREYQLIVFRESDRTTLYSRVVDDRSRASLITAQLGPISLALEPQIAMDRQNRLHAFFLAVPKIFAHLIVNPDGKVAKREYRRETDGNRPVLVDTGTGEIAVAGGIVYDPAAEAAAASTRPKGRSASEKPPGL